MILIFVLITCTLAKYDECYKNTTYCINDQVLSNIVCQCQPGSRLITATDGTFACVSQSCLQYGAFVCNTTNINYCCGNGFGIFINNDTPSCGYCSLKYLPNQIMAQNCSGSTLTCNNDTSCKATKPYCGLVNVFPTNFSSYDCFLYEANLNQNVPGVTYYYGYFGTCCPDINDYRFSTCDSNECSACDQCILFLGWETINYGPFLYELKLKNKVQFDTGGCYPNQIATNNINTNIPFCLELPMSDYFYESGYGINKYETYTCTNMCIGQSEFNNLESCNTNHCCECPPQSMKCDLDYNGLCYSSPTTSCYTDGTFFINVIGPNCDCSLTKISDYPCPTDCAGLDNYALCPSNSCQGRCESMGNGDAQVTCPGLNITNSLGKNSHHCNNDHNCLKCNLCDNYKQIQVGCINTVSDGKCSVILYHTCGSCLYMGPEKNCACNISETSGQQICAFCPTGSILTSQGNCIGSITCTNNGPVCSLPNICCRNYFNTDEFDCVNNQTDPNHCGSCGNQCECGTQCVNGVCLTSDPNCQTSGNDCSVLGLTCCPDGCANITNSISNCGGCGIVCDGLGTECCDGNCVDLTNNFDICGSCSNLCVGGQICENCTCVGCTLDHPTLCDGLCVNTQNDTYNCGNCSVACYPFNACCNGYCTNSSSDPNNCGTCDNFCVAPNTTCCNGDCCNTNDDPNNCGSVGYVCTNSEECCEGICANTTSNCGTCGNVCMDPNTTCCNGDCCDTNNDPDNCGSVGNVCSNSEQCCDGLCANTTSNCGTCGNECISGDNCCNGVCSNSSSDPYNCGTCGNLCPNSVECCDATCANTIVNCGTCGTACVNQSCISGECTTCPSNTTFCNGICCANNCCTTNGTCCTEGEVAAFIIAYPPIPNTTCCSPDDVTTAIILDYFIGPNSCCDTYPNYISLVNPLNSSDILCCPNTTTMEVCNNDCSDSAMDPFNCAACDIACDVVNNYTCINSICTCRTGTTLCNDTCQDSNLNCVTCGNACNDTYTCINQNCTCLPTVQLECDATCVPNDNNNCGTCGNICPYDSTCSQTFNQCFCNTTGLTACSTCVNITNDNNNCGGCGYVCPSNTSCVNGFCLCAGDPMWSYCSGVCVDLYRDPNNCRECGYICGDAFTCCTGDTGPNNPCTNTDYDSDNCGSCGNVCPSGTYTDPLNNTYPAYVCILGTCTNISSNNTYCGYRPENCYGLTCCNGACSNFEESPGFYCGKCGNVCPKNTLCSNYNCVCQSPFSTNCSDVCTNTNNNTQHCGNCTNQCPAAQICSSGICKCPINGQTLCDGICVNEQTNTSYCGNCVNQCSPTEICSSGVCKCPTTNEKLCNDVCIDIQSNTTSCGNCTNECPVGQICSSGVCVCPVFGQEYCSGICIDVLSNNSACGNCTYQCPVDSPPCMNGQCLCENMTNPTLCDGICTDLYDNITNCGSCGNVCPDSSTCIANNCVCDTSGFIICSDVCVDSTTTSNCGSCGNVCPASASCDTDHCRCNNGGYTICEGVCVDTTTDPNNCFNCGVVCPNGSTCNNGCRCPLNDYTPCPTGCTMTSSDPFNCGACGYNCTDVDVYKNPCDTCVNGECVFQSPWIELCEGSNYPTSYTCGDFSSASNCGGCGITCPDFSTCVNTNPGLTAWECKCGSPDTLCGTPPNNLICTYLGGDLDNCGACGNVCDCAAGNVCISSTCYSNVGGEICPCDIYCAAGTYCNTNSSCACAIENPPPQYALCCADQICTCIEVDNDPNNCGNCGAKCDPTSITPICRGGQCECADQGGIPYQYCNGACIPLYDDNNCGSCGNVCAPTFTCDDVLLICTCPENLSTDCSGVCVDTSSDSYNCGGCGIHCTGSKPCCLSSTCVTAHADSCQ